jgi:hypothetical protein
MTLFDLKVELENDECKSFLNSSCSENEPSKIKEIVFLGLGNDWSFCRYSSEQ